MGYGCRHNNSIVFERYDLEGVANVAAQRRDGATMEYTHAYYDGICAVLSTCLNHEWRDQSEFFAIFDNLYMGRDCNADYQ